jgi:hypothetical protein
VNTKDKYEDTDYVNAYFYIHETRPIALAASCSGHRLGHRNRRSWVRGSPGCKAFRTLCGFDLKIHSDEKIPHGKRIVVI